MVLSYTFGGPTKRLGYSRSKYSISYYAQETIYVDGKNKSLIAKRFGSEKMYDGFYAVGTDLEDKPESVVKINQRRWEIEECFRIMKSEFEARPVYLQRKERILAHFITCFTALIVYRYLEKRLDGKYTCGQIIECLRKMKFVKHEGKIFLGSCIHEKLLALCRVWSIKTVDAI